MNIDIAKLFKGERRTLSKAITLIESKSEAHQKQSHELLEKILPKTGKSIRIGISGSPGVGKSTFIESLGMALTNEGHKVAVLAVDPSSPISGGSIMGDKTRMEELSRNENAFIRPSPARDCLGGVAHKTRESMFLCEAAGYDVILIETVGVGQSEFEVSDMVDFFLVLLLPNSGDDLQGIKKGIIELSDLLVVNKADGEFVHAAKLSASRYQQALDVLSHRSFWSPKALTCSALESKGVEDVWKQVSLYKKLAKEKGLFETIRADQNVRWGKKLIRHFLEQKLNNSPHYQESLKTYLENVRDLKSSPLKGALEVIDKVLID